MMIDIVIAFFAFGVFARLIGSDLKLPDALYKSLSIFLMLTIGLKGGMALASHVAPKLFLQSFFVVGFGFLLPVIAYAILSYVGDFNRKDSATVAAHYGSVSVGTYAVAIAVLESNNISYEAYFPLFVVLLEMPAIIVGIMLANRQGMISLKCLKDEVIGSQGIVLMTGGLLIGYLFGVHTNSIMPLFKDLFHGVLALFLLEMGRVAAGRLGELKTCGVFVISFGVFMPIIGAVLGGLLAFILGFSEGGIMLLAVLGASASYIAVPAAMQTAVPDANHGLAITAALAVTFPFNVLVGIPACVSVVRWLGVV